MKHKTTRAKRFFQSFSAISLLLSTIATNGMANELSTSKQKPNIILIVLDDAAYSDLGVYGGEIATPNIDTLAQDGILFTQFHVTPKLALPPEHLFLPGWIITTQA